MKKNEIQPLVTVLMPVYNGEKFLVETIDSVLNQSFRNFEFLIIDDGSTDLSLKIIESYSDERIKIVKNSSNQKIIKTLNIGISLAKGKYIARIDSDDICLPNRFEKQIKFLNENPEIAVVGTDIIFINDSSRIIGKGVTPQLTDKVIKWVMQRRCCIYHPTVMINYELVGKELFYCEDYPYAEDYELWLRLSKKYKLANLKDYLLKYRLHDRSLTFLYNQNALESALAALKKHNKDDVMYPYLDVIRFPWKVHDYDQTKALLKLWPLKVHKYFEENKVSKKESWQILNNAISFVWILFIMSVLNKKKFPIKDFVNVNFLLKTRIKNLVYIAVIFIRNVFYRKFLPKFLSCF